MPLPSVCIFCGSSAGNSPEYIRVAEETGRAIATAKRTIVYGGGSLGMMGAIANSCLRADGEIIGVIPDALASVELMHQAVPDMRVVPDMHARKALMHKLSDAYLALPGGYGTMEELFEVLCWSQLDFHQSPVAVLNINGYFDPLISFIDRMMQDRFIDTKSHALLSVVDSVESAVRWLANNDPKGLESEES